MAENIFILGAGASVSAGAPLMGNFLDVARQLYSSGKVSNREAFRTVFEAISKLQVVHSKSELNLIDLESVFGAFEMAKLLRSFPGKNAADVECLPGALRHVICETLELTIEFPVSERSPKPVGDYPALVQLVQAIGVEKAAVLTFNYDLALDYALSYEELGPQYHLEGSSGGLSVLKLHGSMNWGRCPQCDSVRVQPLPKLRFAVPVYDDSCYFHLRTSEVFSGARCTQCSIPFSPEPVLVPPTWEKTEYRAGIARVWQRAAGELAEAENVFVCGFSLPETDSFFRYLFALGSVGSRLIQRFWVCDPDLSVEKKFRTLLGPGARARFRFLPATFEQAIDQIYKELIGDPGPQVRAIGT